MNKVISRSQKIHNKDKSNSLIVLIAQFLIPGIVISVAYAFLANPRLNLQLPSIVILALVGILVLIPVELGVILYSSKKKFGVLSVKKMVPYQKSLPLKVYLIVVPVTLIWAIAVMVLGAGVNEYIRNTFFSWVPEWYIISANYASFATWKVVLAFVCALLVVGILLPIVEEIYFRGYLLPRMEWMGKWAPLVNAFLFSLYHFWSPWQTLTRTIALLPFCIVAYKTKNIKVTILVHCLLNIMGDGIGILIVLMQ